MKMPKTLKIGRISCQICIFSKSDQQDGSVKDNDTLPQTKSSKKSRFGQLRLCYQGKSKTEDEKKPKFKL